MPSRRGRYPLSSNKCQMTNPTERHSHPGRKEVVGVSYLVHIGWCSQRSRPTRHRNAHVGVVGRHLVALGARRQLEARYRGWLGPTRVGWLALQATCANCLIANQVMVNGAKASHGLAILQVDAAGDDVVADGRVAHR